MSHINALVVISKKTQNPGNPKSAGGLHTDWKNRLDKVIDSLTVDDHSDDTGLGGLDDEDVIAEMPPITVKPKVQSNENPSPRNIKPNAPGYLAPTGSVLSNHIVQVIKVFLPHYAQSALEHGIPIGLLGMAVAGLKRAFRMYTSTGEKSSCTTGFTLVNVNNAVEAYAQSAAKISESRWKRLQDLCGVLVADAATLSMEDTEVFEISASRHLMYDASSPPPESK
ncbi:hypothetical protein C8R41DRAFT_868375 [Lentinula lateritia]|uniref:Uncharacterized protein n=1 Tax=Lentinula lateritia TaxID=40482 RepID=A0ABQ8VB40_9AGAR|nr:hypothetical protein C8R41DRAFT_868375 [Lentinula lateritia]